MIGTTKTHYHEFPIVEITTKTGKISHWQIFAGIVKRTNNDVDFTKGLVPEDLKYVSEPIKEEYSRNVILPPELKGYYVAMSWYDKEPTLKNATFVEKGKNLEKSNSTNVWTQTLADALSKYNKKNKPNDKVDLVLPMLATGDAVGKDLLNSTIIGLFEKYQNNYCLQTKFDGVRLMIRLSKIDKPNIFPYSRSGDKSYISNALLAEIRILCQNFGQLLPYKNCKVYLDGEYYNHNMKLQEITSAARVQKQTEEKDQLIYYIFDIVLTDQDNNIYDIKCSERLLLLKKFREFFEEYEFARIVFVTSIAYNNAKSIKKLYLDQLKNGYEGLIMRILDRPYESGKNKNMIKLKQKLREEFTIIGFSSGKGKSSKAIMFKCQIDERTIALAMQYLARTGKVPKYTFDNVKKRDFKVTPQGTIESREQMLKDAQENPDNYIGKMYSIEFQDWSEEFKPIRPSGIEII